MTTEEKPQAQPTDDSPRFGLLALICFAAVASCGFIGWLVSTYL